MHVRLLLVYARFLLKKKEEDEISPIKFSTPIEINK